MLNLVLSNAQLPYDSYPNPELGDWDAALELNQGNPNVINSGRGDEHYRAPENRPQNAVLNPQGLPNGQVPPARGLTIKSDIWSLGLVIWDLMNSTVPKARRDDWHDDIASYNYTNLSLSNELGGYNGNYSVRLHRLRNKCLKIDPAQRPTPHQLARECRKNLRDLLPKSVGKFSEGVIDPHLRLEYNDEQFNRMYTVFRRRAD